MQLSIRLLGFLFLALCLQACSTRTEIFKETSGVIATESIAQLAPITLGGSEQWLLVRGVNKNNPVLLFLHGGPGSPYIGLANAFQSELEKHFVVVQWDQRGSGKSFPNTSASSMTVAQFEADTHELVLWLRQRFQRDKIYLLGHSWGTYLGLAEAQQHPENLYAYIGTGQMIDLVQQEQLSHNFVTERAKVEHNEKALKQLSEIGDPPYKNTVQGMNTKYSLLWEYGGMLEGETGPYPFVMAMLKAKEYSLLDISRFVRGMSFSLEQLANNEGENFWRLKAPDPTIGFQVPVYFITGEHDHVTPLVLIDAYVSALKAPQKGSFVLPNAGHFAFFTDPKPFARIMTRIVENTYQKTLPEPMLPLQSAKQ